MKLRGILGLALLLALLALPACGNRTGEVGSQAGDSEPIAADAQEVDEQAENEQPEDDADATSGSEFPLPDMDTFIERYNEAAGNLGAVFLEPDDIEPMRRSEGTVVGGFVSNITLENDLGTANNLLIMFDPYYVRIVSMTDYMDDVLPVYAAVTAAVTGMTPWESEQTVIDLVENAEEDTWDNGHEVNLNDVEIDGLLFEYEQGRATRTTQFLINFKDNGRSVIVPDEEGE